VAGLKARKETSLVAKAERGLVATEAEGWKKGFTEEGVPRSNALDGKRKSCPQRGYASKRPAKGGKGACLGGGGGG